ncbi:NAD(P)H-binding protein [uncultured Lactobacillus sp.]|mgnify:CR=1 FL=1|uniref:NAD(P)H-binding protein n=1 Tax=uncultured Lactobacillus sp. TaxID=153152 RepID=UPI002803EE6C|nr:NAD(P)H-binding protein [uncultured Lactobacillus sp.]
MKLLILGAAGKIGQLVTEDVINDQNVELTLFAHDAQKRLAKFASHKNVKFVDGDFLDQDAMDKAMQGQNMVVLAYMPKKDPEAKVIVDAMEKAGVKRCVITGAFGIFNELEEPMRTKQEKLAHGYDGPLYTQLKKDAKLFDDSQVDDTYLRMPWLNDEDTEELEVVPKGKMMHGAGVSRKAVAKLISKIVKDPSLYSNDNIGLQGLK